MTQEMVNKIFDTEIGIQLLSIYSTPDDSVFIRYNEAKYHCQHALGIEPEYGVTILEWFPEY